MSSQQLIGSVIDFLIFLLPIIVPVLLVLFLFNLWVNFARSRFISEKETVLLRITPPQDVLKTPLAMELFINGLYQTQGEADILQTHWQGSMRPWFSLEIASNGGDVGFYIWAEKKGVRFISTQLYAQYPGIEVTEVEDYTEKIDMDSGNYKIWGLEYQFTEPDPVPIMTYVDYGLDKPDIEEENKTDPITPTLEFMGSLGAGEYAWLQIIVRAHKKEDKDPTKWFSKTDFWKDDAAKEIKKIREDSFFEIEENGVKKKLPMVTEGQKQKIKAIERSLAKLPFDTGIRGLYIAEKDVFDKSNIGGLVGSFKQYSSTALNGFKPAFTTKTDWWNDPFGRRGKEIENEVFEAYKARDYFWRDFRRKERKKMVMNSEELATIFHFPGRVATTPSLQRVQSIKSDPPANLPL